jgi:hypothetical protein
MEVQYFHGNWGLHLTPLRGAGEAGRWPTDRYRKRDIYSNQNDMSLDRGKLAAHSAAIEDVSWV